jgi:hypothetical protein
MRLLLSQIRRMLANVDDLVHDSNNPLSNIKLHSYHLLPELIIK